MGMKWREKGRKEQRAEFAAVSIILFLSLLMVLAGVRFYRRYREQVIRTEESQLLTIAGIIGNNLDSFLSLQLQQIDLLYAEDGEAGEQMESGRVRFRTEYFMAENGELYNWITLTMPDGELIQYHPEIYSAYENEEVGQKADAGTEFGSNTGTEEYFTHAQIAGKKISSETGWYELYIRKDILTEKGVCRAVFAMNLECLYQQIVAPVKIGNGGYSSVKDQNMHIIMHHARDQIGLEAYGDRVQKYPGLDLTGLNAWIVRQSLENAGTGILDTYVWDDPYLSEVRRVVAFQAINVQGERWIVNSTIPISELSGPLNSMMGMLIGGVALYILILVLSIVFLLRNHFLSVSQQKEIAYLKEINQGMEMLAKKNNEIRHYQRIQSLGMMSSHVAHEFNNYLTPVLIYAELLENDASISEENQEMIREITSAVDKAANLSRELLAFSRQDTGIRLELLNFTEEVKNAAAVVQQLVPAAITLRTEITPEPLFVLGRRGMAEHILMNLCKNAFQAMEKTDKKELTIRLEAENGDKLLLQVSDTGCGIGEDAVPKIFEPFYTTKGSRQGTGLGLSVVQNMVTSVGGTIRVESQIGQGTAFLLEIPRSNPEDEKNMRKRLKTVSRIVIVSTDERMKKWKNSSLGGKRTVDFYGHPAAVIDRIQKNPEAYGMVIADYTLPTLNGIELCEVLRRIHSEIRLVLVAEQSGADFEWYLNNGIIDRFLLKGEFCEVFAEMY